jgi:hypothetical protein
MESIAVTPCGQLKAPQSATTDLRQTRGRTRMRASYSKCASSSCVDWRVSIEIRSREKRQIREENARSGS